MEDLFGAILLCLFLLAVACLPVVPVTDGKETPWRWPYLSVIAFV